ncbi:MAG TPA: PDZ domain-containing protein [Gemmataceae bacterium]|nr:PDZ domain-containing protein [Gemmataceae bacterium]
MLWRTTQRLTIVLVWLALMVSPAAAQPAAGESIDDLMEKAIKAAVRRVAPSIVAIETSGGTDIIATGPRGQQVRKGAGPTTGVIVSPDGYIVSSAFNFANKPSSIFVAVPGHPQRYVARAVATDQTRMLTLLKIDATALPVPAAVPKSEIRVGQTALALGRTLDTNLDHPPSISQGIISAVNRIWGKAIQTDAKVSPANYGGPLVDLMGRVFGVLVPASPRAEGETAGVEWYDSGIGFAIPLEDVFAVLPRLKEGKDLKKGLIGITVQSTDWYGVPPVIASTAPGSAAAAAGIKPGDLIKEVDGKPVANFAQVLHIVGTKYEGDTVSLKVQRGEEEINYPNLRLGGMITAFAQPFLGILPMRDDPELGVEIRYVYPKSPADTAGLKPGDRIMKLGVGDVLQQVAGREALGAMLGALVPETEVKLEVVRQEGKKTETLTLKLGEVPALVPEKLPQPASQKKALEPRKGAGPQPPAREEPKDAKKPETGLLNRTSAAGDHSWWIYVPEDYDPNISHALLIWLHPAGKGKEDDIKEFKEAWQDYCGKHHLIVVAPKSESETGWVAGETEAVLEAVRDVLNNYTIDRRRIVAHGMGIGGQMAFYLGFQARDLIRGVATTGAVLTSQPKERVAAQPLAFFLVVGDKDPVAKAVAESKTRLTEHKYPVIHREIKDLGHQYLDLPTLEELVRWIDSLDRM